MFAIHASYRGGSRRRVAYVAEVVEALANADSIFDVTPSGVSDFTCLAAGAEEAVAVVMSLLQAGDFAIGIGASIAAHDTQHSPDPTHEPDPAQWEQINAAAARAVAPKQRAGAVTVRIEVEGHSGRLAPGKAASIAEDIASTFTLIDHVLSRRTKQGREATALLRAGHLQSEAAAVIGISKQAMSQRLHAAGWHAEQSGWSLAVHMLARVDELH